MVMTKSRRIPNETTNATKDRGSLKLPEAIDLELTELQIEIRREEGASASKRPAVIRRLLARYRESKVLAQENGRLQSIISYLERGQTPPIATVNDQEFFREVLRRCHTTNLLGELGSFLGAILRGEVQFGTSGLHIPQAGVAAANPDLAQMSTPELIKLAQSTATETEQLVRDTRRLADEAATDTSKSDPNPRRRKDKIA